MYGGVHVSVYSADYGLYTSRSWIQCRFAVLHDPMCFLHGLWSSIQPKVLRAVFIKFNAKIRLINIFVWCAAEIYFIRVSFVNMFSHLIKTNIWFWKRFFSFAAKCISWQQKYTMAPSTLCQYIGNF